MDLVRWGNSSVATGIPDEFHPDRQSYAQMTAQPPRGIACDADALAADLAAVDALARLQLGARRQGSAIRLHGVPADLRELLAFCGLSDILDRGDEPPRCPDVPNSGSDPEMGSR